MAASTSNQSSAYWKNVDIQLKDGRNVRFAVDLPTYRKICDNDEETLAELVKNYLEATRNSETEIASTSHETPTPGPVTHGESTETSNHGTNVCARHEWTDAEIRRLLYLIKENIDVLNAARNKSPIWKRISDEINISPEKCMDKYKYLRKAYRNYVQLNNRTGAAPTKFPYAGEMGDLLGDDPSVTPQYTASSDPQPQSPEHLHDDIAKENVANEHSTDATEESGQKKTARKRNVDVMINYLQERDENLKKMMMEMHRESMDAMNRLIDKF